LPIFQVHGLFVAIHGALINGSKMIWLAKFDPKFVTAKMPEATVFMGVPTMYVRLLDEPAFDNTAAAGMRLFISGSAPLLAETFRQFESRTGQRILERYGMSETVMLTSNPYLASEGERRGGTVGRPLPGVELKITDDDNRELPWDGQTVGALKVRGLWVCRDYYRLDGTGDAHQADGWFVTGDICSIDPSGFVRITDRAKDVIKSGGEWISSIDLENAAMGHPDVAEAAVIGVPHEKWGEVGLAVLALKPGATIDLTIVLSHCVSRLAKFKVPNDIAIIEALPRNATGKVLKRELRVQFVGAGAPKIS
jgi:malonyl-CoA/methylmalonyl-CoA synthetase